MSQILENYKILAVEIALDFVLGEESRIEKIADIEVVGKFRSNHKPKKVVLRLIQSFEFCMKRLLSWLFKVDAIGLLIFGLYWVVLMLLAGHHLNTNDPLQMRLVVEIFLFIFTAFCIFFRKLYSFLGNWILVLFLFLVQLAFVDLYLQIAHETYDQTVFFALFFTLFLVNLLVFVIQLRTIFKRNPAASLSLHLGEEL